MSVRAALTFMVAAGSVCAPAMDAPAEAGAKPVYSVGYSEAAPSLDGGIEADRAWEKRPWSSGFAKLRVNGKPVGDSRFKALYTGEGLYFAVECSEPEMDKIHDEKRGDFWTHDVVELFLHIKRRDGEGEKTHLILSARSARHDEFDTSTQDRTNFKTGWGGKSMLAKRTWFGKKVWTAEFFVPFYTLGIIPENGLSIPANLCRHASPRKEWSSWSFQQGDFHNVAGFGVLKLAPAPQAVLPAMRATLTTPHFVSVPYRFGELKGDWDLLQSGEGRGLIAKLGKSLVDSETPAEQAAALADFNRLEQLYLELRKQCQTAAEMRIFSAGNE